MVDARYRNTKNGRVAVVVQEDLKCKTVLLQYEDDGKEQQISTSTLKRWWQELDEDDEEVDDVDDEDEDLDDEDYEDDDEDEEDYDEEEDDDEEDEDALDEDGDDEEEEEEVEDDEEEVEEEKPAPKKSAKSAPKQTAKKTAEKKTEKKASAKKPAAPKIDLKPHIADVKAIAEQVGFEWKSYEKIKNFGSLCANGHGKVEIRFSNKKFSVNVKEVVAETCKQEYRTVKYFLPAIVDFEYSGYKSALKSLLSTAFKEANKKVKETKEPAKKSATNSKKATKKN